MKTYMITYDLNKPGQNYGQLYDAIKGVATGWLHPLNNIWLVVSPMSSAGLRDYLIPFVDGNDKLLVMEVGLDWASLNLGTFANGWLLK
jgi:hypothetical protein